MHMLREGSIYTKSARFDEGQHFLTEDEIRKVAPSVFATEAHESRSDRFAPIATIEVLRALDNEGFGVVGAQQAVARMEDRKNFTKHMLRLRRKDDGKKYHVGDNIFEIILKNANDGSAAYDLLSGLWRIRCMNSLVSMSTQMSAQRVRHTGDVTPKVIDGVFEVIKDADRSLEAPAKWSQLLLAPPEQEAFAKAAHGIRFPVDEHNNQTTNVEPAALLKARRVEDKADDLWTVFNRVQENAIKGGLNNYGKNANGAYVRRHSRPVKGIDQSTALNRALWTLGEEMAKLKA